MDSTIDYFTIFLRFGSCRGSLSTGMPITILMKHCWRGREVIPYGYGSIDTQRMEDLFLGAFSIVIWSLYFLIIEIDVNVAWEPEFWGGAIVLAALSSIVLSKLSTPESSG
jgi:hypothetical protein